MEELFVVEQHQTALTFDQIPRHPVTASVKTSEDIQNIIDPVTYNKAAAILRMIKHTVSENNFHEPLKLYLENAKYGLQQYALYAIYFFYNRVLINNLIVFLDTEQQLPVFCGQFLKTITLKTDFSFKKTCHSPIMHFRGPINRVIP